MAEINAHEEEGQAIKKRHVARDTATLAKNRAEDVESSDSPAPSPGPDTSVRLCPRCRRESGSLVLRRLKPGRSELHTVLRLRERKAERQTRIQLALIDCIKEQIRQSAETRRAWIQHNTEFFRAGFTVMGQMIEARKAGAQPKQ